MRKNFLILMLMALLPLAGWAQIDISDAEAGVSPIIYGTTTAPTVVLMKNGTIAAENYSVDTKFYTDATLTTVKANGSTPLTQGQLPAGTWYIKVTGIEAKGFTGTKAIPLTVNKKAVTATLSTPLTKVYGASNPELVASNVNWSSTAFENGETKDVFFGTYDYTLSSEDVGTQTINVTGLTADNYTLSISGNFTITAKPITAAMTAVELSETYKGTAFTTFAVDVKDGSKTLVAGTDFDVKAYNEVGLSTEATPTNVATYYLAIEDKTGANYSVATHLAAGTFEITKAGLRIAGATQTKKYDGTIALVSGEDSYTVTGLQGSDVLSQIATINAAVATGTATGVGTKTITVSKTADGSKIGNYDLNLVNGTLTIEPRPITITAKDASKKYNQADEDATGFISAWPTTVSDPTAKSDISAKGYSGVTVGYTGDDTKAPFASGDGLKFFGEKKSSGDAAKYAGIYVAKKAGTSDNKGEYEGALEVKVTNSSAPALANYDITYVAGKYTIAGGKIYVTAEAKTKEYGDEDPELTYVVDGLSEGDALTTEPTLTREAGEDVKAGGYTINLAGAVAPDGYEEIVYGTAKLTITKAPLTVTLPIKKVNAGQTIAAAEGTLTKDGITIDGFKKDETVATSYALSLKTTLTTDGGTPDNLTDQTDAAGYILTLVAAISKNYQIALGTDPETYADNIAGKLIVGAGDATSVTITNFADIQTYDKETRNVKINFNTRNRKINASAATHTWAADNWNALVLPFDITVAELSNRLGFAAGGSYNYAVVNTVKKSSETGKFQFEYATGTIAANTPFMVKTVGKITTTDATEATTITGIIDFGTKTIKAPASATVSADLDNGFKLVGTYTNKVLDKTIPMDSNNAGLYKFMYGDDDSQYRTFGSTSTNSWTIVPFDAYVDLSGDAASAPSVIFEFEDANGISTAIKSINADVKGNAVQANGWYTLNGVKLQAAPAQKGVYIKDGKKVVIK